MIRAARLHDIPAIIAIEVASGELFRDIGMMAVADDPAPTPDELLDYIREGFACVATDDADRSIGYILFSLLPDALFVTQVTIDPRHAHQGIGASLLINGDQIARRHGREFLLLTTFRDVPWNAPYYERLGFTIVDEPDWTPWMTTRMALEAARGLTAWPRVVMRRAMSAVTA